MSSVGPLLELQPSSAVRPLSHTVSAVAATGEKIAGMIVANDAMTVGTAARRVGDSRRGVGQTCRATS